MKKIIASLFVAIFMASSFAAPPDSAINAADWELIDSGTTVRVTGTTAGTIFTKKSIQPGWEYVLSCVDSIGGTTDSAYITAILYGSDGSTQMGSEVIHVARAADARYSCNAIPVGQSFFGRSISATFTRYNITNKSKISRWELYRRRPLNANINWNLKR